MRHYLLPALLLLGLAPAAHAVPITTYAIGRIGYSYYYSDGTGHPYNFDVGEPIKLEITYDDDPAFRFPRVWLDATTSGGGHVSFTPDNTGDGQPTVTEEDGVVTRIAVTDWTGSAYLNFGPDWVGINYGRDNGSGSSGHGFIAVLETVDAEAFVAPEPSTLAMGLVGAALAGIGWMRRREAA